MLTKKDFIKTLKLLKQNNKPQECRCIYCGGGFHSHKKNCVYGYLLKKLFGIKVDGR